MFALVPVHPATAPTAFVPESKHFALKRGGFAVGDPSASARHDYPHPSLQIWCAFDYNGTRLRQSRGGAGASLLTAVRLS